MDLQQIYQNLSFLSEPIRLRYTNFIYKNYEDAKGKLTLEEIYERLKKEEPIEYILNLADFCGNQFYVDNRVLIPRPETEGIVEKTLNFIQQNSEESYTIVDVGTGSGIIALSLAFRICHPGSRESGRPGSRPRNRRVRIIGIDISKEALEVAKINRAKFGLESEVDLQAIDFRDFDFTKYENLIVLANLPYVPASRKLQPSVNNYEPHLALFGGQNGDELILELKKKFEDIPNLRLLITEEDQGEIKVR